MKKISENIKNKISTLRRNSYRQNYQAIIKKIFVKHVSSNMYENFSYSLPSYLISYPRSGSNFLQSVLSGSAGIPSKSIYSFPHNKAHLTLSMKAHSLSYDHLIDEINRLVPGSKFSNKLIVLQRDPRDVMISFFEFLLYKKEIQIPQADFLNNVCYFYATFKPQHLALDRKVEIAPTSIIDSYRKFVNNWIANPPNNVNILLVKFENLVLNPESEFQGIFDFLELDCLLNSEQLKVKVSQYHYTDRPRATIGGWKLMQHKYSELISMTNELLHSELVLMGYEI
jgi:hypothetical protein